MAKIAHFRQSNLIMRGWEASEKGPKVHDLPVYRDKHQYISCWRLTWWERIEALVTGRIWIYVLGQAHPPIYPSAHDPWRER